MSDEGEYKYIRKYKRAREIKFIFKKLTKVGIFDKNDVNSKSDSVEISFFTARGSYARHRIIFHTTPFKFKKSPRRGNDISQEKKAL